MIVVIKDLYTLKSWEDQDTESLAFHLNNKKIWDNCRDGLPYPYTKGNARFFIKQAQEKTDISDFCITVGGEAIGNIGFVRGTDVERFNAEVGYWISEKYWNQGIVSDALTEAIQYYFAHTEVIRIFATVYEYNPASMRVLEKAGRSLREIPRKPDLARKQGGSLHRSRNDYDYTGRTHVLPMPRLPAGKRLLPRSPTLPARGENGRGSLASLRNRGIRKPHATHAICRVRTSAGIRFLG